MSGGRVLVTGASGLIGTALRGQLSAAGRPFTGLCRHKGEADLIAHDFAGEAPLPALPERVETVVHLVQSPHFRDFPNNAAEVFNVNVKSTLQMIDYARRCGARRFVYASSGGIYGFSDTNFTEDSPIRGGDTLGFYLGTKRASEILVEPFAAAMTIVVLRFFFVYGRGQRPQMLISRLVRSVRDGAEITLQGKEGTQLNPIHVSDAAAALMKAINLDDSMKINVAGPETLSIRTIAGIIGAKLNRVPVFRQVEGEPQGLVADISKMRRHLAEPKVAFAEGIVEVCDEAAAEAGGGSKAAR